jgi:hypothetical protein
VRARRAHVPDRSAGQAGRADAIDIPSASDIKTATNYINQALDEALAGKPLSKPTSQALAVRSST